MNTYSLTRTTTENLIIEATNLDHAMTKLENLPHQWEKKHQNINISYEPDFSAGGLTYYDAKQSDGNKKEDEEKLKAFESRGEGEKIPKNLDQSAGDENYGRGMDPEHEG